MSEEHACKQVCPILPGTPSMVSGHPAIQPRLCMGRDCHWWISYAHMPGCKQGDGNCAVVDLVSAIENLPGSE